MTLFVEAAVVLGSLVLKRGGSALGERVIAGVAVGASLEGMGMMRGAVSEVAVLHRDDRQGCLYFELARNR